MKKRTMLVPCIHFYPTTEIGKYDFIMNGLFGGEYAGITNSPEKEAEKFLRHYSRVKKTERRGCNIRELCEKYGMEYSYIPPYIE